MSELNKKKKILWIGDDIRMNSGCATMGRQMILDTVHKYDFFCFGGAITHPEKGKIFDLSQSINEQKKIKDAYVKVMPIDGYGNEQVLFQTIDVERPDAICMITDPRFYGWLFALEHQIRGRGIPIIYWSIWDDCPYPMYNNPFYSSCDALFGISKQTHNIHKQVLGPEKCCTINDKQMDGRKLLQYVPHGIDAECFHPIPKTDANLINFRSRMFSGREYNFVILYNSRNVQRKRTSNIILAYRQFCDNLPKETAMKCVLVLHTEIMQEAGTNLMAIKEAFCPDYNIVFSPGKLTPQDMNMMYNVADVTINASSNEGFGLSTAESIMSGTPIIATVTGGLQDQLGQTDDTGNPVKFSADFGSNNVGKYKKHGPWAYPVFPATRMIQGSIPTPYIFDDIAKWEDFAEGMMYWYLAGDTKRVVCGAEGRRWALNEGGLNSKNMGQQFINGMEYIFENWQKPKKFGVYSINDHIGNTMKNGHMGFEIPKIDTEALQKKLEALPV